MVCWHGYEPEADVDILIVQIKSALMATFLAMDQFVWLGRTGVIKVSSGDCSFCWLCWRGSLAKGSIVRGRIRNELIWFQDCHFTASCVDAERHLLLR